MVATDEFPDGSYMIGARELRERRAGTIPGAAHVFWRDRLDARGAFRPPGEVRDLYLSKGATSDKTLIPVCHGGYRSANTLLALKSLGYPIVRNYVGAWGSGETGMIPKSSSPSRDECDCRRGLSPRRPRRVQGRTGQDHGRGGREHRQGCLAGVEGVTSRARQWGISPRLRLRSCSPSL